MTQPLMRTGPGIYYLEWAEEKVAIRYDRFDEDAHHNLSAELTFTSITPPGHLKRDRLNLTSSRSKLLLAKSLTELVAVDWVQILEQGAEIVLTHHREGEPAIPLYEVKTRERTRYRLEPLLVDGYPTLIFGPGGAGKSLLALYFANLVSLPSAANGLTPEPGTVLYLDYEFTAEETKARVMAMFNNMASPVLYRFCHQALPHDIEAIRTIVLEHNVKFMIVDSAGPACGGDPENAAATLKVFIALRSLQGVTHLIIAHLTKEHMGKSSGTTPFGCYSADTEVLTHDGWCLHSKLTPGTKVMCFDPMTENLSWEMPSAIHTYDYDGPMVHLHSGTKGSIDSLVTPEHRMVVKPGYALPKGTRKPYKNPREWHFTEAKDLKDDRLLPYRSCGLKGNAADYSVDFAAFLGWWLSEGCLSDNAPVLTQAVGPKAEEIISLIKRLGYDYHVWQGRSRSSEQEVMQLRIKGRTELGKWLRQECGEGAYNKHIPRAFLQDESIEARRALLASLLSGDGSRRSPTLSVYSTCSSQLADDVQILAISLGYGARVKALGRSQLLHRDRYAVYVSSRPYLFIKAKRNIEEVHYTGKVYCLTVPTGAYITRRKGYMLIAGNSVYWWNMSRNVFEMRSQRDENALEVALVHRKTNFGRFLPAWTFKITSDAQGLMNVQRTTGRESVWADEQQFLYRRITEALKRGSKTPNQIAEELNAERGDVGATLRKLRGSLWQVVGDEGTEKLWGLLTSPNS